MLSFFGAWLRALIITVLTLALAIGGWVAWRLNAPAQSDDKRHLGLKRQYLQSIEAARPDLSGAPNILFILFDDLGYGDIGAGAAGSDMINTPNIDALAAGGVSFSDFHSPAAVCSPARAGYLTGRLPARAGMPHVLFPSGSTKALLFSRLLAAGDNTRLPAEEITLADILAAAGYATGMVGKWHLGDSSPSLPNDFGFDSYYGALYSNDQQPFAFYRNRDIEVTAPANQERMTEHYVREAVQFIDSQNGEQPFFLYFAHNFPHDPLHVRAERIGRSRAGLFGDVMEEIDEGIGTIITALERSGLLDNTLLMISSDNGPWYLGNAGDLRGRKGSTFEGGMRVPFIAHWPDAIAPGQNSPAMAMGTDLVPTVLEILDLPAPSDRVLDGRSLLGVLTRGEATPHDYLYYTDGGTLLATRDQRFKYRAAAGVHYGTDSMPVAAAVPQKEWLFDLAGDQRESYDTSDRNPNDLNRLREAFRLKAAEMQANLRGWAEF